MQKDNAPLALAFESFHFEPYLRTRNREDLNRVKYQYLHTSTLELYELTEDYLLYVSATINQEQGKKAEFWMKYVQLIHVYHEYSRNVQEGDLHGYTFCLS